MLQPSHVVPIALLVASCSASDPPSATRPKQAVDTSTDPSEEEAPAREAPPAEPERPAPRPLSNPRVASSRQLCKLVNREHVDDPTQNATHFRANLKGTDLGIPHVHDGTLYLFFGDSWGFRGIWQNQSAPDAVGFSAVSPAEVARAPETLCQNLRFLGLPPQDSVGPRQDARIERDFAGVFMRPPPGRSIRDFIHHPAGPAGAFPNMPGDFEVPSGVFSHGGAVYLFYTTVESPAVVQMKASYLAKWAAPSPSALPVYDILYDVDQRFDDRGPMRGDFINVAALVEGEFVYLYGTGNYRRSRVHLARKRLASIETPGGFERYDARTRRWMAANVPGAPIVEAPGNGELSVRFYPALGRFMMLNQEELPTSNRVIARFAEHPEGPWSDAVVVADMGDSAFRARYCCGPSACAGEQMFHCDRAGFYGTYLMPEVTVDGSRFVVTYVMSTWDPYNVVLMQTTFE